MLTVCLFALSISFFFFFFLNFYFYFILFYNTVLLLYPDMDKRSLSFCFCMYAFMSWPLEVQLHISCPFPRGLQCAFPKNDILLHNHSKITKFPRYAFISSSITYIPISPIGMCFIACFPPE